MSSWKTKINLISCLLHGDLQFSGLVLWMLHQDLLMRSLEIPRSLYLCEWFLLSHKCQFIFQSAWWGVFLQFLFVTYALCLMWVFLFAFCNLDLGQERARRQWCTVIQGVWIAMSAIQRLQLQFVDRYIKCCDFCILIPLPHLF